jgi:hypothetical protein
VDESAPRSVSTCSTWTIQIYYAARVFVDRGVLCFSFGVGLQDVIVSIERSGVVLRMWLEDSFCTKFNPCRSTSYLPLPDIRSYLPFSSQSLWQLSGLQHTTRYHPPSIGLLSLPCFPHPQVSRRDGRPGRNGITTIRLSCKAG